MEKQSQVQTLVQLVDYQTGAVVSREIVSSPTGTVTIFAFDNGEGLSEHTAPFDALVQCLEGNVEIHLAGQPYTVAAGQILLMPAHVPHALHALTPFKMLLTMIRG